MPLFTGTAASETLSGTQVNDTIDGLAGNDILNGLSGVDFLYGGDGNDRLVGGFGNDLLDGGNGDDTIDAGDSFQTSLADHIDGGSGVDSLTVRFTNDTGIGVTMITQTGLGAVTHTSHGLEFQNIETLTITGTSFADRIDGGDGNDTIWGGSDGADILFGRGGDDVLLAGGPGSALMGGDGNDDLTASGLGGCRLQGGDGDDHLASAIGSDRLDGDAGNDALDGWEGDDFLYGGDGNDTLSGDAPIAPPGSPPDQEGFPLFRGHDVIQGGAGDDVIFGGMEKDTLTGGSGSDRFVYFMQDSLPGLDERDVITDFSQADHDHIDLSGVYVTGRITAIPTVLTFIGAADFTGSEPNIDQEGNVVSYNGQINYRYEGGGTVISGDTNGDKVADLEIVVAGHLELTANDFLL